MARTADGLRRDHGSLLALAVIAGLVVAAASAPAVSSLLGLPAPDAAAPDMLGPTGEPAGPSAEHPLGADAAGRDVLSRLLHAAPVTLAIGVGAAVLSTGIGAAVGLAAALAGPLVDRVLSRLTDAVLCFPVVLLALGVATACSGGEGCLGGAVRPGAPLAAIVLGTATWGPCARAVRAEARTLRAMPFVEAARVVGASPARIAVRELLPNLLPTVLVLATFAVPAMILLEGGLSLLGAGVPPPAVTWGGMIADGLPVFDVAPAAIAAPAAAVLVSGGAAASLAARLERRVGRRREPWRAL